ncbi:hypothetical protein C2W62_42385 [Candidatus Entotheonella serta]|nr:hypothetical protein C2W62_42385 [Candidatus Entotheonella serta]
MAAEVGSVAPDFTMPSANDGDISLSQYRGSKHVILSFHVLNFTGGAANHIHKGVENYYVSHPW